MNKEIIYSMNTAYRGEYEIQGFSYGSGEKTACIVGAMRGNEFQQLYISSLLAKKLSELEARGAIVSGKQILLIPSLNYSSFNVGKKYWITDNSRATQRVRRQAVLRLRSWRRSLVMHTEYSLQAFIWTVSSSRTSA